MARDGTNRGGIRPGQGAGLKAPVAERIEAGDLSVRVLKMPEPETISGFDMPPLKDYMTEAQKDGMKLCAAQIFEETWRWLGERGCAKLVNPTLVERYAMECARCIQCEQAINKYGFVAAHPTTRSPSRSPFVSSLLDFKKQANATWYLIYQVVRDACTVTYTGNTPQDDFLENLLSMNGG